MSQRSAPPPVITPPAAAGTQPVILPKARDLTVNKVLAGAGAAATSAVLGSLFGATGTVVGAAVGSVASTVAGAVYQRSLDRTRNAVITRIRVSGRRPVNPAGDATVPMPRLPADAETVRLRVPPADRRPRRRPAMVAGATVLVFVLAMAVVTGLEWIKGSTLAAQESGTSVGRVLDDGADKTPVATTPEPSTTPEPTTDPIPDPTTIPQPTTVPGPIIDLTPDKDEHGGSGSSRPSPTPLLPTPVEPGSP